MDNRWSGRIDPDCSSFEDGNDVPNSNGKETRLPMLPGAKNTHFDKSMGDKADKKCSIH